MNNWLSAGHYHSQRNNSHRPFYECGNTSLANLICSDFYPEEWRNFDIPVDNYIYEWLRGPKAQGHAKTIGAWAERTPEQVPEMLRYAAQELTGITHGLTWKGDEEIFDLGVPFIIASRFYQGRKDGHYVMVGGKVVINDPLGNPLDKYKSANGYGISMSLDLFMANFDGIAIYPDMEV